MEWLLVSAVNVERQPEAVVIIVRLRRSVVFSNIFDELYSRLNSYRRMARSDDHLSGAPIGKSLLRSTRQV